MTDEKRAGADRLLRAMSDIDDRYIAEAQDGAKSTRVIPLWISRTLATAACLAICVLTVAVGIGLAGGKAGDFAPDAPDLEDAPPMNGGSDAGVSPSLGYSEPILLGGGTVCAQREGDTFTLIASGITDGEGIALLIFRYTESSISVSVIGHRVDGTYGESIAIEEIELMLNGEPLGDRAIPTEGDYTLSAKVEGLTEGEYEVFITDHTRFYPVE